MDHSELTMKDLAIALDNRPGALAEMGEALGRAGVSVEGGGAFVVNGQGGAHFLFEDGMAARKALEATGILVLEVRDVLVLRLNQIEPALLQKVSSEDLRSYGRRRRQHRGPLQRPRIASLRIAT